MKGLALVVAALGATGFVTPPHAQEMRFGAAGVPRAMAESRNYPQMFSALSAAGARVFLPTFQYVEQPAPRSLGFETDFYPPCASDRPAFTALRASGVQMIASAELLYPDPLRLPPLASDPLKALIACAGPGTLFGVANYDEPVLNGVPIEAVAAVAQRVRSIAPGLPVIMVHAPILADNPQLSSGAARAAYLRDVVRYSDHADIVGFDIYPIPDTVMQVATPFSDGAAARFPDSFSDYMAWMKNELPGKRKLLVLQGFKLPDLYEPQFAREAAPPDVLRQLRAPNRNEFDTMVEAAADAGVELVLWWGASALTDQDSPPWPDIMSLIRERTR